MGSDGSVEIVWGSGNSLVHALRMDGSQSPGFPAGAQLNEDYDSSPALADINGDGALDMVIGASNGTLFARNGLNGAHLPGFPIIIEDSQGNRVAIRSSPVVADVDNDGSLDVVFGGKDGRVFGYNNSGNPVDGFPIQTGNLVENGCAIWDVDGDGLVEIMASSFDQKIYCWDTPWAFSEARAPWPMFKRNMRNTGVYDDDVLTQVAAPDLPTIGGPALLQNYPNPFHSSTVIRYRVPEGLGFQPVTLEVFDVSGRVVRTLIDGSQLAGEYELRWDGEDEAGRTVAAGIYHYRLQAAGQTSANRMVLLRR